MRKSFVIILFLFNLSMLQAQDTLVFNFSNFIEWVASNHPLAKQANLLPNMGAAQIKIAKGSFDPTLEFNYNQKTTKGINSYQYIEPEIKIPTQIGLEFKAGMDQSSGTSVNPEIGKFDPSTGKTSDVNYQLMYAGFQLPVLRGLLTDQRRIELKQAKVLLELNKAEQTKIIYKLFVSAAKDYWLWQAAYQKYKYIQSGYELAQVRLNFIRSRIKEGEEKPIDSVEAFIELKKREVQLTEANLELSNARTQLSGYLWDANSNPVLLLSSSIPSSLGSQIQPVNQDTLTRLLNYAQMAHPEIQQVVFKLNQLELDNKLAYEYLKPQLNIAYHPFQTYTNGNADEIQGLFAKNYKLGLNFKSSLFLRKERGKIQLTTLKIKETQLALQQGKRDQANRVMIAYNELENLEKLRLLQQALVDNSALLRNAEILRFEAGESSLFMVNQRERTLIEAQSKLAELVAKYAFAKHNLYFSAGLIFN